MPNAKGKFLGITISSTLPWQQEFQRHDVVRCVHDGREGVVEDLDDRGVWVVWDCDDYAQSYSPGELRPA